LDEKLAKKVEKMRNFGFRYIITFVHVCRSKSSPLFVTVQC